MEEILNFEATFSRIFFDNFLSGCFCSNKEAKRKEIKVLGPDVNRSYYQFEVEGNNIRMGLTSIKGLALKTAEKVIEERKNGEYLSVEDFQLLISQ